IRSQRMAHPSATTAAWLRSVFSYRIAKRRALMSPRHARPPPPQHSLDEVPIVATVAPPSRASPTSSRFTGHGHGHGHVYGREGAPNFEDTPWSGGGGYPAERAPRAASGAVSARPAPIAAIPPTPATMHPNEPASAAIAPPATMNAARSSASRVANETT